MSAGKRGKEKNKKEVTSGERVAFAKFKKTVKSSTSDFNARKPGEIEKKKKKNESKFYWGDQPLWWGT